jgi:hypothetical protein
MIRDAIWKESERGMHTEEIALAIITNIHNNPLLHFNHNNRENIHEPY